jgi:tRNA-Thr(GGU) m(6)t(6)A37 methyltransferase TsaA
MSIICYNPIGIIRTPFSELTGMPIQAVAAAGVRGEIELDPVLVPGLRDLEGFSHLILVYHLHQVTRTELVVTPFLDTASHGIFATRGTLRPNPVGLSTVRLVEIHEHILVIEDVDIVNGTPLVDIKPYVPQFDNRVGAQIGWFEHTVSRVNDVRADQRYQ